MLRIRYGKFGGKDVLRTALSRLACVTDVSSLGTHWTEESGGNTYLRFEVSTAVTMKNVVFWDIKTQFVLHRRHITFM
jgi:hypothetical protein